MTPRATAKLAGESRYFTGKPCKHGHVAERVTATGVCTACLSQAIKLWSHRNPERVRLKSAAWRAEHPERVRAYQRKHQPKHLIGARRRAGLPEPTRPPPEKCEICGGPPTKRSFALDHCHEGGFFRGWLCNQCNIGLGMFKDNPEAFLMAFRYLAQFSMPHIRLVELTPEQAASQGLQ